MKDILPDIKKGYLLMLIFLASFVAFCLLFSPSPLFFVVAGLFVLFMYIRFSKLTMIGLGIFLIFQELIVLQFGAGTPVGMALKRSEEAVILLAILIFWLGKILHREKWERTSIDIPLVCLVLIAVLSSIKSHIVPYKLAAFDLFLLLKGFLVFYIFYNLDLNIKDLRKTLHLFLNIALLIFILGIIDLIVPGPFRSFIHNQASIDYRFGIPSVQSIFIHPGVFGWFMAFFASFCFSLFLILEKKKYLLFSILFILGALLSMRFKPVAGLISALLVSFILVPGFKKVRFIFVAGLLILIFVGFFGAELNMLFKDKVYDYLQSPDLSNQARNVLYSTSVIIAKDFSPLGSGLATYGGWISTLYYSPLYTKYGIDSVYGLEKGGHFSMDTFWPYLIGQFGLIGTLCYGWILISFFRSAVKGFKKNGDPFLKAFMLGTTMILVEAIIESIASPVFLKPPQYFFIFACLGITYSLNRLNKEISRDENSPNK